MRDEGELVMMLLYAILRNEDVIIKVWGSFEELINIRVRFDLFFISQSGFRVEKVSRSLKMEEKSWIKRNQCKS